MLNFAVKFLRTTSFSGKLNEVVFYNIEEYRVCYLSEWIIIIVVIIIICMDESVTLIAFLVDW